MTVGRVEMVEERRGVGGREVAASTSTTRVNAPREDRGKEHSGERSIQHSLSLSVPYFCSRSLPPMAAPGFTF